MSAAKNHGILRFSRWAVKKVISSQTVKKITYSIVHEGTWDCMQHIQCIMFTIVIISPLLNFINVEPPGGGGGGREGELTL